jgi:2-oxoglutarate dehydrogenase E2 component (dihydrolipoamide succinyltransferase)
LNASTGQVDVVFPEDQQEGTEAVLAQWLIPPGQTVEAHQPIAEIETDKVMVEVAAPATGAITEIRVQEGGAVNPGDVLCTFTSTSGIPAAVDRVATADTPEVTETGHRMRLSPAVRHRLMEHDIDPAIITGTGRNGRITVQDVEAHVGGIAVTGKKAAAPASSGTPSVETTARRVEPVTKPEVLKAGETRQVPHDSMRRRIAANMVTSLMHTAPHVTAVFEADLSAVMRHRAAHKAAFAERGTPLTLTAYFVAATVAAIEKVPQVNSQWHDDYLEIFADANIGIGTALGDKGLIVTVIQQANEKSLSRIAADLADLTSRAREGRLSPADVRGGTFTISNHGVSGSLIASPQSAILGVGKIEKRIRVMEIDGEDVMKIRPMCYVSLTIDHRVIDGYQTNAFLTELTATLENWPS